MAVYIIIISSILLQFLAAYLALRLVRVTGRITAWILIAAAIVFMALRRSLMLYLAITGAVTFHPEDVVSETIALITSALMAVGVGLIGPLFRQVTQAAEAIRQSEEKYRLLVTNIPAIVFTGYADGSVDFFDHKVERITGYPREAFESRRLKWLELVLPEDLEGAQQTLVQAIKGQEHSYVREYRIKHKKGQVIWIQERSQIILDEDGRINYISGVFFDITEHKQLEEMLRASEARFRSFMEHSPTVAFLKDTEGRYVYVNGACERFAHRKIEEWIGRTDYDLWPAEIAEKHRQSDLAVMAANNPVAGFSTVPTPDGQLTHWAIYKFPVPAGLEYPLIGGIAMDITERRLAEEALRTSEARYRTLVDNISLGITLIGSDYKIIMTNPAQGKFFHKPTSEFVGRQCFREFEKRDEVCIHCPGTKAMATGRQAETETLGIRDDGSRLAVRIFAFPIFGPDGKATGFIEVVEDITERRKADEALRESQEFLRTIMESIRAGIVVVDAETHHIADINPFVAELIGIPKEQIIGQICHKFICPAEIGKCPVLDLGLSVDLSERQLLTAQGETIPILKTVNLIQKGSRKYLIETFLDITEQRRARERLEAERQRLFSLLDGLPAYVFLQGPDYRFYFTNRFFRELFGEPEGRRCYEIIHGRQEPCEICPPFLVFETRQPQEWEWTTASGRIYQSFDYPFVDIDGSPLVLEMGLDITARKQAEEVLQDSYKKLRETLGRTVTALAAAAEMRDPYTAGHQQHVTRIACAIAREMGLTEEQIEGIEVAGALHDIGKISVPAEILSKPGKLNEFEFQMIKVHAQVGYAILKGIEFPWPVAQAILQHHERLNGSGYPIGLSAPDIILEARILAVADVVEAMASHRPYRPALGIDQALEEISQNRGILYDPEVVDTCVRLFTEKGFTFED